MTYNQKIPPFKWFILENFPYIEEDFDALTNWQLFCKLGKEMNKIIEKCNLTGEQVERLTTAFNELKEYIDEYFENLDVQEEVNIKLDEMAQSGELAELISQYLESQAIIGFNTCSSLASATNLANGSFARTLGRNTYNDGYGAFYKIRTRTNVDDPDGYNLIALTNTENLVAEKIGDSTITSIQSDVSTLQGQVSTINQKLSKKYIFIGDSYNTTDTPAGGVPIVPWSTDLASYLGLTSSDYYNSGVSGAGWVNGNTFLNQLQTLENSMTSDVKNSITDIVVLGGINDASDADIYTAIGNFSSYVATHFPNAMITIGCISWAKGTANRANLRGKFQVYNNMAGRKNIRVLDNIFTAFHNYLHYQPDGHPNASGSMTIAYFVANALKGGENNVKWTKNGSIASSGNTLGITADTIGTFQEFFSGNTEYISVNPNNTINCNANITMDGSVYTLGQIQLESGYFDTARTLGIIEGWLYHGNTMTPFTGKLIIETNGVVKIMVGGNGSVINSVTIMHISASYWCATPAEYC